MRKIISVLILVSFIFVFSGCAVIFTGGRGIVNATSNPKGAEVFINGISYGKTPVKIKLKTKIEYEITFKKAGYNPVTKRITNKVGAGWIILDVIMGLVPVIVDAATGAWYQFDQKTVNAMLERSNGTMLKKKTEEIPIQETEPAKKEIITERQSSYTKPAGRVNPYTLNTGSPRVSLRSSYWRLSKGEVKSMLKKHDFFDSSFNKGGDFRNDFHSKTINGDKVVVDKSTGLMWHQGGSRFFVKFSKAEKWIRALNSSGYAGYYDWRLPTLEEAASLLESSKSGKLYIDPVFSQKQGNIWTGDKHGLGSRWGVDFSHGRIYMGYWDKFNYVRPVRVDN